jgi:hypothetical protein
MTYDDEPVSPLYALFLEDPVKALEEAFKLNRRNLLSTEPDEVFVWCTHLGTDGLHYGRYRDVRRSEYELRKPTIEFMDGNVSFFFTDKLFDPKANVFIEAPRTEDDDQRA